jgi:hypothetical protein
LKARKAKWGGEDGGRGQGGGCDHYVTLIVVVLPSIAAIVQTFTSTCQSVFENFGSLN